MKKINFLLLLMFFSVVASAQNLVLPDETKAFYEAKRACNKAFNFNGSQDEKTAYFKIFEQRLKDLQQMKSFGNSYIYQLGYYDYARSLADQGNYEKAAKYFDKAFYAKVMSAEEFAYADVRGRFANDTALYQKLLAKYRKNELRIYSYEEYEIRKQIYSWFQMDQLAFKLSTYWPLQSYETDIIAFKDSLIRLKINDFEKEYSSIEKHYRLDSWSLFFLMRHLACGFPDVWLEQWEPRDRQRVLNGDLMPEEYAFQYDYSIIHSGQGNSYYGEYNNCGDNVNADTALVNRHRADIGLPPLEEKSKENVIRIVF